MAKQKYGRRKSTERNVAANGAIISASEEESENENEEKKYQRNLESERAAAEIIEMAKIKHGSKWRINESYRRRITSENG